MIYIFHSVEPVFKPLMKYTVKTNKSHDQLIYEASNIKLPSNLHKNNFAMHQQNPSHTDLHEKLIKYINNIFWLPKIKAIEISSVIKP